jgi:rhodanese-related sulfurtransferase
VVDVRSPYEFETLRVKGAVNVPVSDVKFVDKVRALRGDTQKPLVFYCNGKTCAKSYDAARKATLSGKLTSCYAYDAGIFEWARTHGELTELLGKNPIAKTDLIEDNKFKAHLLDPKEFQARIGANAIVLDVRDPAQRDVALFPFKEKRISLDRKKEMAEVVEQAKRENKTLLVYDKVGHQVQWVQYHLEKSGLQNYYFMKGGEEAYFKATLGASSLDSLKR